jgi:hypothetical protein
MVLPQTELLAASGGLAGVEEHAPESSLLVTGLARCWKLGESRRASYSLESSSVANVGLASAEESAR